MSRLLALITTCLLVLLFAAQAATGATAPGPGLVRAWYLQFLHREADAHSVAVWSYLFRLGNSREEVLAEMLGTDEYYRRAGRTPEGLVDALFADGVQGEPTASAKQAWVRRARRSDRRSLATAFIRAYPQTLAGKTVAVGGAKMTGGAALTRERGHPAREAARHVACNANRRTIDLAPWVR